MIKRKIWVTFQKEGLHCYPAAATDPKLEAVKFLANEHRHIFYFRVELEVFTDDRDVEFILLKRELEKLYDGGTLKLNHMSCEMMAEKLIEYIVDQYPRRNVAVSVAEDNENGAVVEYHAK